MSPLNSKITQPVLETKRLRLRPFVLADAGDVQVLAGNFAIADTTLNVPHPYPDGGAETFIAGHAAQFAKGENNTLAITLKSDGTLVGAINISVDQRHQRGTIGYWIGQPFWNQGYATEAGRPLLDFVFTQWKLHKVVGTYLHRNPASGRVMQKLGFVQEGVLKEQVFRWGRFDDLVTCAVFHPTKN
jgi:RimJ/RimL family protein N-acetyltransferase